MHKKKEKMKEIAHSWRGEVCVHVHITWQY